MGWLEDKAAAEAQAEPAEEPVAVAEPAELTDDPCPKCGASGDEPCLTKAGNPAKKNHKERS